MAYTRETHGFSALGGYEPSGYELTGTGEPAQVNGARMTAEPSRHSPCRPCWAGFSLRMKTNTINRSPCGGKLNSPYRLDSSLAGRETSQKQGATRTHGSRDLANSLRREATLTREEDIPFHFPSMEMGSRYRVGAEPGQQ